MTKRPYVPWMTRNDVSILEYLAAHDATLSPMSAFGAADDALEIEGSLMSVLVTRLPLLFAAGLIEETAAGEYDIAELGEAYLSGDLDPDELETPESMA